MLLIVMWISVEAIAINMAVLTTLFTFVNAYPNTKLLNYSLKEQLQDILPALGMSLGVFVIAYFITYLPLDDIIMLIAQIVVGVIVYTSLSILTKNKEYKCICNIVRNKLNMWRK
jgi:hypothetical protein